MHRKSGAGERLLQEPPNLERSTIRGRKSEKTQHQFESEISGMALALGSVFFRNGKQRQTKDDAAGYHALNVK